MDDPFGAAVAYVEGAKRALLGAMPSPRGKPGAPLASALAAFEERLRRAADVLRGWRDPRASACREAVAESLDRAERLRLAAPPVDYEGLVAVLGDLLDPLDAFDEAAGAG